MGLNKEHVQMRRWDDTYYSTLDYFGTGVSQLGRHALIIFQSHEARRILQLGCGPGYDTIYLAQNGMQVTGMDYSETALCKIREDRISKGLEGSIVLKVGDARNGLPFDDEAFDGCYSHMFFTMQFPEKELFFIFSEVLRVLKPGGLNVYSVRNVSDPHFGIGRHLGEGMWQNPLGFVVHFFDEDKVRRLAKGYDLLWIKEFDDPSPPFTKKLFEVALQKPKKAENK